MKAIQSQVKILQSDYDSLKSSYDQATSDFATTQEELRALKETVARAKTAAEILNALLGPLIRGEKPAEDLVSWLSGLRDEVEATGDAVLREKLQAAIASKGGSKELAEFSLYLLDLLPRALTLTVSPEGDRISGRQLAPFFEEIEKHVVKIEVGIKELDYIEDIDISQMNTNEIAERMLADFEGDYSLDSEVTDDIHITVASTQTGIEVLIAKLPDTLEANKFMATFQSQLIDNDYALTGRLNYRDICNAFEITDEGKQAYLLTRGNFLILLKR